MGYVQMIFHENECTIAQWDIKILRVEVHICKEVKEC